MIFEVLLEVFLETVCLIAALVVPTALLYGAMALIVNWPRIKERRKVLIQEPVSVLRKTVVFPDGREVIINSKGG